jgi:hypothetical protein
MYLFCSELKAVAASENLFDGIWHYEFLLTQKYHAPFRSVRAANLLGGLNELIRMKGVP